MVGGHECRVVALSEDAPAGGSGAHAAFGRLHEELRIAWRLHWPRISRPQRRYLDWILRNRSLEERPWESRRLDRTVEPSVGRVGWACVICARQCRRHL